MTGDQWVEIVEWVADRFPHDQWHAEQAVAYFEDLKDQDATDVWEALLAVYENGVRFAPNGSELLAETRKVRRRHAVDDLYRKNELPEPSDPTTYDRWSEDKFGEVLRGDDLVARLHAQQKSCASTRCEIHNPADAGQLVGGTNGK